MAVLIPFDSFVKYGTDFSFSITPDAGYVPTVKYSAQDENGNEIIGGRNIRSGYFSR